MQMSIRNMTGILAVAAVLLTAGRAQADNIGTAGAVVGVEISEVGSDEYTIARGRLFIDEGGVIQVYPWQGTACNGRVINDQQIDILVEAMTSKKVRVIPYWRVGAGGVRCLVAFTVAPSVKQVPLVTR
jgi:hypothetical protein